MAPVIELKDATEGEHVETSDFFFDRIGEPVPVKPTGGGDEDSKLYDVESLPSQPLAVSERRRLIFVAHSSGFCVSRTGDVMEAAKEIKDKGSGSTVMELSLVDVSIGKVRILSLSPDSSTLAASVGTDIHFFSVDSLLKKEQNPFFTCSVEESSFLKDFRWLEKMENSFAMLSNHGKLYSGDIGSSPKCVMDDVDAVDVKGNFIAVARGNIVSILSSTLNEKLWISLSFNSWTKDSAEDCHVKVDSVRWIRPDCIVLGCFELNSDGMEENYFVEVIRSTSGWIHRTDDMVGQSFYDVFPGIIDDILPAGDGPYLFCSYLDQCKLAIVANRKNTDQHVVLFSWLLGEEQNEVVVVDIDRDKWLPRIELQENGDDNLIVGLCVDKISMCDNVKVQLGVEEERELSPCCVLLCLTLEGKLTLFHIASLSEGTDSITSVAQLSDEEDEMSAVVSQDRSGSSISLEGSNLENDLDIHKNDRNKEVICDIPLDTALKPPEIKVSPLNASEADDQPKLTSVKQFGQPNIQGRAASGLPSGSFDQKLKFPPPLLGEYSSLKEGVSQANSQTVAGEVSASASFAEKILIDGPSQLMQNGAEAVREVYRVGSSGFQIRPSQTWGSGKTLPSANLGSAFTIHSNVSEGDSSKSTVFSVTSADVPATLVRKPEYLKEATASSLPVNSSSVPQQIGDRASRPIGHIESLPSIRSSQLSFQEAASGLSSTHHFGPSNEDKKSGPVPGISKMESGISKQFGNITEMVRELDMLLDSIEGKGGFKDACILAQKSSVEALEKGIDTLSNQCTMWKGIMDERLEEVQQLLDRTVQVLSRKTYIEEILKQATDDRYWELWSHQSLNPELELKRKHIMKLNQDLTNQLILLERHFNTLELEKFGDIPGGPRGRQGYRSGFGPSRSAQSLHAVHNTVRSQLMAAEQLSVCLSRQMEVLSIDSPPIKPRSVKKDLFEAIGLPYDDSFSSPVGTKVSDTPSSSKLVPFSNSAATKDQSRRKQPSALEPSEPGTARRRRDSLGQGWTSFEPPKTTVKRMILQESQKVSASRSPLLMDEQHLSSSQRTAATQKNRTTPSTFSYQLANDAGMRESSEQMLFQRPPAFGPVNESPGYGPTPPTYQTTNLSVSSIPRSLLADVHKIPSSGSNLNAAKPTSKATTERPFTVPVKETDPRFQPSAQMSLTQKEPSEISSSTGQSTMLTKSPFELIKQGPKKTESSPHVIVKSEDTVSSSSFGQTTPQAFAPAPEKVLQFGFGLGKSSSGEVISPSTDFKVDYSKSMLMTSSSSSQQSSSSTVSSTKTTTSVLSPGGSWNVSKAVTEVISPSTSFKVDSSKSLPMISPSSSQQSSQSTVSSVKMTTSEPSLGGSWMPEVNQSPNAKLSFSTSLSLVTSSPSSSSSSSPIFSTSISSSSLFSSSSSSSSSFLAPKPLTTSSSLTSPVYSSPESCKPEVESDLGKISPKLDVSAVEAVPSPKEPLPSEATPKLALSQAPTPTIEISSGLPSGNEISAGKTSSPASSTMTLDTKQGQPSTVSSLFSAPAPFIGSAASQKVESSEVATPEEDGMEEEAPETNNAPSLNLASLNAFGLGSSAPTAPKENPFGSSFGNVGTTSSTSSPFTLTVPSGDLFRPASFSYQAQKNQPSQLQSSSPFSGGFRAAGPTSQALPTQGGFGQPAQIGGGQQALGSVLGSFGQSRQIGTGLPGAGLASSGGFTGGFGGAGFSSGGFSSAATSGGFAGVATKGGGFGALATNGGGFAGAATGGGSFANVGSGGGGFGGAASAGVGFANVGSVGSGFGGAASAGGGFANVGSGGGGFGGAVPTGGGFGGFAAAAPAGGGFAGAASGGGFSAAGGGFGAFGGQQAAGGFSGFGGSGGNNAKPPELFTQMRK